MLHILKFFWSNVAKKAALTPSDSVSFSSSSISSNSCVMSNVFHSGGCGSEKTTLNVWGLKRYAWWLLQSIDKAYTLFLQLQLQFSVKIANFFSIMFKWNILIALIYFSESLSISGKCQWLFKISFVKLDCL